MHIRFLLFVVTLAVFFCGFVLAQSPKTLLVEGADGNDPIRIVKAAEGTTELTSDKHRFPNQHAGESTFTAGDDWIKDLSFVIRNVSNQNITYAAVFCNFLETADWRTEIPKHATDPILGQANNPVGWRPQHALYSSVQGKVGTPDSTRRPAFILKPNEEFTISLEEPQVYEALRSHVEKRTPMSKVNACQSGVAMVFFEDGTMWQGHRYYRAAEEPGKWTVISFKDWTSGISAQ
jgi:hypothetical protein